MPRHRRLDACAVAVAQRIGRCHGRCTMAVQRLKQRPDAGAVTPRVRILHHEQVGVDVLGDFHRVIARSLNPIDVDPGGNEYDPSGAAPRCVERNLLGEFCPYVAVICQRDVGNGQRARLRASVATLA